MQIDDETLMALADGELDQAAAARVSAAIADDPEAQARLRRFTETRARLRALTAETQAALSDDALIGRIRAASLAPQAASVVATSARAPANTNRAPLVALAAALAAAVIGIGWWQMGSGPAGLPQAEFAALDRLPSGEAVTLDDGRELTVIASYRTAAGDFCREYETVQGTALTVGVACRQDGAWQQQFASDLTATEGYVPASGDIAALDDWLAQTGAGEPLTLEDEAAALSTE